MLKSLMKWRKSWCVSDLWRHTLFDSPAVQMYVYSYAVWKCQPLAHEGFVLSGDEPMDLYLTAAIVSAVALRCAVASAWSLVNIWAIAQLALSFCSCSRHSSPDDSSWESGAECWGKNSADCKHWRKASVALSSPPTQVQATNVSPSHLPSCAI